MCSHSCFLLFSFWKEEKNPGWVLLLQLPTPAFWSRNIVYMNLLFTWKQISNMDGQLYLTSLQEVSVLQPHNMAKGASSCSYFHYQKNYAENLLDIWKTAWWHFPSFLWGHERERSLHWLHFRTSFYNWFFCLKIILIFHSFFNNRLAERILLSANCHFYTFFFF